MDTEWWTDIEASDKARFQRKLLLAKLVRASALLPMHCLPQVIVYRNIAVVVSWVPIEPGSK